MERQDQEIQTFDTETVRLGLNAIAIAEACESIRDNSSVTGSMLSLAHSNSSSSFARAALWNTARQTKERKQTKKEFYFQLLEDNRI